MIIKADSIAELAEKIKVPADALTATVEHWNKDITAGKDTEFGRILKRDLKGKTAFAGREAPIVSEPLGEGPYYAVALYPTMLNTQGGPKKNVSGQVMDTLDRPVPRLYAAGELGSMWGSIYQGACNNAECIVFGRIAGRNAAAEADWK